MSKRRIWNLWYAPVLGLAMGLMLARLLVIASLLDVSGFAAFSVGLLVSSTFCMLACLGLQPLLQRELPLLIVRRLEKRGAVLVVQSVFVALACAALAIASQAFGIGVGSISPALIGWGVLHGLSQQLFLIATVESRSRGDPVRFARQSMQRSLLVLAIGAGIAFATSSALWTLAAEAVMSLFLAATLLISQLHASHTKVATIVLVALRRLPKVRWSSAVALLAVTSTAFVVINADRWVAAHLLPPDLFAQYAFAWTLLMMAQSLQVLINASLYPALARRFASEGREAAFRISAKASLGLLLAGTLLAIPLGALLHASITNWFSAYSGANALLPAFLLIAVLRVSDFWSSFLVISGQEIRLLVQNLAIVLLVTMVFFSRFSERAPDLLEIAYMAASLSLLNYVGSALAAWRGQKQ